MKRLSAAPEKHHMLTSIFWNRIESVLPVVDSLWSGASRLVEEYNIEVKSDIDKAAPLAIMSYLAKTRAPWFIASHFEKRRRVRCLT